MAIETTNNAAASIMLTSGASGRINALFSLQVLKSLLKLINAFVLLLLFPLKRCVSTLPPISTSSPEKGGKEEKQEGVGSHRKGPVVRVPATVVSWRSTASAAVAVDHDVAARRALAIRRVMQDDGGDESVRDFSLFVTSRGDTMFTQSWTPVSTKVRSVLFINLLRFATFYFIIV